MEFTVIYEIIEYAASILVALSLMMSKIVTLRIINLIGAALFFLYGILIDSIPVAAMNGFIVLINVYFLFHDNQHFFAEQGIEIVESQAGNDEHAQYLEKMGFTPAARDKSLYKIEI